jgi:hypothetical protein
MGGAPVSGSLLKPDPVSETAALEAERSAVVSAENARHESRGELEQAGRPKDITD